MSPGGVDEDADFLAVAVESRIERAIADAAGGVDDGVPGPDAVPCRAHAYASATSSSAVTTMWTGASIGGGLQSTHTTITAGRF